MKFFLFLLAISSCYGTFENPPHEGWRLIVQKGEAKWLPEEVVSKISDYMDITDHQEVISAKNTTLKQYPTTPTQEALIASMMSNSSPGWLSGTLFPLTFFHNRYYRGSYGVQSAQWIFDTASRYIEASGRNDVTIQKFEHDWPQFSVIARIEGTSSSEGRVIFGAHQDSINLQEPDRKTSRAPGADDDGSGSVVILEALRVMLESGFEPVRSIEFQWYAAEEVGLLGSQDIAEAYARAGVDVYAMLQIDMCGGVPGSTNPGARIMTDYAPQELINFLVLMLNTYTPLSIDFSTCGACSDHASWSRVGYPAVFPIENESVGGGHTAYDDPDELDYEYMWEYVWLVSGFGAELATM